MSLAVDFTSIPRLAQGEFRLPAGDFLPTTPVRRRAEPAQPPASDSEFHPSYRMPDCLAALRLFGAGLAR